MAAKMFGPLERVGEDDGLTMRELLLSILLLTVPMSFDAAAQSRARRTLSGMIYFTNDTPPDKHTFPVELFTSDRRRRVAATRPNKHGGFELRGVRPGRYVLKLTWPRTGCELWYRADLRRESKIDITIVMDAACSGGSYVRDLPTR
jgi:hypothetical protein